MLKFFYKNKLKYKKGQIAPVFIVMLVILIIMALITVNLSKVAMVKTHTANSVDAGALAAGSAMANLFNSIAQANSQLEAGYWEFFADMSLAYTIAMGNAVAALTTSAAACPPIGFMGVFIASAVAMLIATTGNYIAQLFLYMKIRQIAEDGWKNAVKMGYQFSFQNSGIGSSLKEGFAPLDLPVDLRIIQRRHNYSQEFDSFLQDIVNNKGEPPALYNYDWLDGQERYHNAEVRVVIQKVDTFKLKVAVFPYPAEVAAFSTAIGLGIAAETAWSTACGLLICCAFDFLCCPLVPPAIAAAVALTIGAMVALTPAFTGLAPGPDITSTTGWDAAPYIICWIEDVVHDDRPHDRLVKVDTVQSHEGAYLGLWQTKYPLTASNCVVDFSGNGRIHPPSLHHDATIQSVDLPLP